MSFSFWSKRRVNEVKTVNNCFHRRARAKQGASEAKNSRVMRLCLRAVGEPLGVRVARNKIRLSLEDNLIFLVEAAGKRGENS